MNVRSGLKWIVIAALSLVFLYSAYQLIHKAYDYYQSNRLYSELRNKYGTGPINVKINNKETVLVPSGTTGKTAVIDDSLPEINRRQIEAQKALADAEKRKLLEVNLFQKSPELLEINKDIVGWIKIPNTNVDYPIVKTKDNDYYLNHDFNMKKDNAGCIFMDYRNTSKFSDTNTILYGHDMKNQSMFHDINNYKDKDFFDANKIIYIYTPDGVQKWEVFLVYVTHVDFNYLVTKFPSEQSFHDYLGAISQKAYFVDDVALSKKDKILTLSTCSYEFDEARTVVNARLVQ